MTKLADTIAPSLRWRVAIGGIICEFCAGMLYSWSLYVNPLVEATGWERSSVTLTFSITTLLIPIFMILAGKVLARIGPTKTALIGAAALACGLGIASTARALPVLYAGYGVLGGVGVGFIYGTPISTSAKWFPDRKGLISGLTVAGFGMGSIVFAPVCTQLIEVMGPHKTFLIQGAITVVGMLIGAPMMKTAPDGYRPPGWAPQGAAEGVEPYSYTTSEMLRLKQYWFLLIMYLFANVSGLFIIGHASPISQEVAGLTAIQAGTIVSVLSIANTLGRFLGGAAADRFGAARVVTGIYILNLALLLVLQFMTNYALIAVGLGGLAVCFGGMMGCYPALVLDYFGPKYYSTNYAFVFLAFAIGGLVANGVASVSTTQFGGYTMAFLVIGASCAVGVVMSLLSRPPKRPA